MRSDLSCFAVAAFFAAALDAAANLFTYFFNKEWSAAGWAGLVDGTIPQSIFARRILTASKE